MLSYHTQTAAVWRKLHTRVKIDTLIQPHPFSANICPAEGLLSKTLILYQLQLHVSTQLAHVFQKDIDSPVLTPNSRTDQPSSERMHFAFLQLYDLLCNMGVFYIKNPDQ